MFKDQYREFGHLLRELLLVRAHNKKVGAGDAQDTLLMFAEASLVLVAMERFLRIVLADKADDQTLYNLLQIATKPGAVVIELPPDLERDDVVKKLTIVRNGLQHGNYEQIARESGCATSNEYFQTQFAGTLETLFTVLNAMVAQIDPATGKRYS